MLHCQALRVMDNLWQSRSVLEDQPALVLFPMPYGCLATGKSGLGGLRGLIEIVPGSKTIRQIDGLNGPMAHLNIGHTHLFRYLTEVYDKDDYGGGLDGGGDNSSSWNDRDDQENKISRIVASKKEQVCDIFSRSLAAACASTEQHSYKAVPFQDRSKTVPNTVPRPFQRPFQQRSKTVPIPFQDRSKTVPKTVPRPFQRPFQDRSKTVPRPFQ